MLNEEERLQEEIEGLRQILTTHDSLPSICVKLAGKAREGVGGGSTIRV